MGAKTGIQWTDSTWNPVRGCSRLSSGCTNCYAESVARRFSGPGLPYEGLVNAHGRWNGTVRLVDGPVWDQPSRWRKPRRIFVNSMSDLFHEALHFEDIAQVFGVMALKECNRHTFQVLTKRPARMAEFFVWAETALRNQWPWNGEMLDNVWLGVSVENQEAADERIPHLLRVPAAVRFLSCEPLLGPVDLTACAPYILGGDESNPGVLNAFNGLCFHPLTCIEPPRPEGTADGIQWVIAGGESGPRRRPADPAWLRDLRDQCVAAGVPFFLKQADLGTGRIESAPELDGRQWLQFPAVTHG